MKLDVEKTKELTDKLKEAIQDEIIKQESCPEAMMAAVCALCATLVALTLTMFKDEEKALNIISKTINLAIKADKKAEEHE